MRINGILTLTVTAAVLFAGLIAPRVMTQGAMLSNAELLRLGTSAKASVSDHTKLAAHYRAHAVEHETDAKTHEAIVANASHKLAIGRKPDNAQRSSLSGDFMQQSR